MSADSQRKISDEEVISSIRTLGIQGTAKKYGMDTRQIYRRRRRIEGTIGATIQSPIGAGGLPVHHGNHPERVHLTVKDGIVVVGSDGHYWPGKATTAHRAFVKFCRDLRPTATIMNGDAFDGSRISRHPPIGWEKRPKVIEELEAVQERLHEIELASPRRTKLVWLLGNHDCLNADTQLLVKRGWVNYTEIRKDDEVLSLNKGIAEWSPINEILVYPYEGEMISVESRDTSMSVTPNHRVMTHGDIFYRADNLPYAIYVPVSGLSKNMGVDLSDDQLRLAGWILTDGSYSGNCGITIYQSKPDTSKEIRELLTRLGLSFSVYTRERNITEICGRKTKSNYPEHAFRIKAEPAHQIKTWLPVRGKLPDWAHHLTDRQFKILLDTIVAGDGSWDGRRKARKCCVIYKDEGFLSSLQSVAVQHGWRSRVRRDNRGDYILRMFYTPKLKIEKPNVVGSHPYSGNIWCLRVSHENFMVRRNGCAYFTGNSRFETRLAQVVDEYEKIKGFHLKDHISNRWMPGWSCWINDDVVIKHRWKSGVHGTHNNAVGAGVTMITGHDHALRITPFSDYRGTRWGVSTGTLSEPYGPQYVDYTEDNPRNQRAGFIVLSFNDGHLLPPEMVMVYDSDPECVTFRGEVIKV